MKDVAPAESDERRLGRLQCDSEDEPVDRDVADSSEDTGDPVPKITEHVRQQSDDHCGGELPLRSTSVSAILGIARPSVRRTWLRTRDWKGSVDVDAILPRGLDRYATACAWTLARAHARSSDRIAIAAYLDKSDRFDRAVAEFATAYADLSERDHEALSRARGAIESAQGV